MGSGQPMVMFLDQQFIKPPIPQFAGCHLQGDMVGFGIVLGIEAVTVKRDLMFSAVILYQRLITIGLLAPQAKIPVSDAHFELCQAKQVKHHHRIQPTADREKYAVSGSREIMFLQVILEPGKHKSKVSKVCGSASVS